MKPICQLCGNDLERLDNAALCARCFNQENKMETQIGGINKKPYVYLACPYTHENPAIRQERFDWANKIAAELIAKGVKVISPISHSHPIAVTGQLEYDWKFWKDYDEGIVRLCCHKLIVLCLYGWDYSVGVRNEIEFAKKIGLEIEYYDKSLSDAGYWKVNH